jgi:hypothetical protein
MALTKKDILLGLTIDEVVQRTEENFTTIFDEIDNGVGATISVGVDKDYKLTVSLLGAEGNTLSSGVVDLPIESMVVDATYEDGNLILTLQGEDKDPLVVPIGTVIGGLVPESRTINQKPLSSDITLTQDDIGDGETYKRFSSTEQKKLSGIDGSLIGVTADEIGKVKDVQVKKIPTVGDPIISSVLDEGTGIATITLTELASGYVAVDKSRLGDMVLSDGKNYKAIVVEETDMPLEVYNIAGNKILTQSKRVGDKLYICIGQTAVDCYLRTVGGYAYGYGGGVADGFFSPRLYRHNLHIHFSSEIGSGGIISADYHGYATITSAQPDIFAANKIIDIIRLSGANEPPIGDGFNVMLYPASGFAHITAYKKDPETGDETGETWQYQEAVPCGLYVTGNIAYCWFGGDNTVEITPDMVNVVEID